MNKKVLGILLIAILGVAGGVIYGKGKVETKINDKVFNQIKSLENKFVDKNGTKNGSITLDKKDVNCVVSSTVVCTIQNLVIDNELSTTKVNKVIITNIESAETFYLALKEAEKKNPINLKNNIAFEIQNASIVSKMDAKQFQGFKIDKLAFSINVDIANNIANLIEGSIETKNIKISKFDKVQSIPNSKINFKSSKSGSNVDFSNENFQVKLNTLVDLSDFTDIETNKKKITDISNLGVSLTFKKSLLEMEKSFFDIFEQNGMPEQAIGAIKMQIDLVNKAIANKEVFIPNTRKGFPQYTSMIKAAGLDLKNKDADLEKVLSYVTGDTNTINITLDKKVIEIK